MRDLPVAMPASLEPVLMSWGATKAPTGWGLTRLQFFSHGSGGRMSKIAVSARLVSPEASLLGRQVSAFWLSPRVAFLWVLMFFVYLLW